MTPKATLLGLAACAALLAPTGANAVTFIVGGGPIGPLLSLSTAGLEGGAVATLVGGEVYTSDLPFADIPAGGVYEDKFLAAGPTAGQPATLTFTTPVTGLSFLWGSPDTYNRFLLTTNLGSILYTATSLGFPVTNGNQNFSTYVAFAAEAGEEILSASFYNTPVTDAFEVANFSISAIPEPASWAMLIAGFAGIGTAFRTTRRRQLLAV